MVKDEIKELLDNKFDVYSDVKIANGEVKTNSNDVPYGDTYANEGDYVDEEDMDRLKEEFIDWLKEDENAEIKDMLEDNDIPVTEENINLTIELANEV